MKYIFPENKSPPPPTTLPKENVRLGTISVPFVLQVTRFIFILFINKLRMEPACYSNQGWAFMAYANIDKVNSFKTCRIFYTILYDNLTAKFINSQILYFCINIVKIRRMW